MSLKHHWDFLSFHVVQSAFDICQLSLSELRDDVIFPELLISPRLGEDEVR